jgi:hypothetical protein
MSDDEPPDKDSYVEIDLHRLDWEAQRQSRLVKNEGERLSELRFNLAEKKAFLDLQKATLELAIRGKPEAYMLDKVTEATIAATIVVQPEYKTALKKYNVAKYKVDDQEALVNALEHKKRMIEKEVDLFLAGYFGEPKLRGAGREMVDESGRQARKPAKRKGS